MSKIRREWGRCAVCGQTTWLYQVEGLTVRGRCLQCWMDAADAGIISGREAMEQIAEDERISSIESMLNSLIQRLPDLEHRLSVLERSSGTLESPPTGISHNYLNRVISEARHDYKKWVG
ncbi:unnamed protein product [marine sediment metagenome]|uniref:Uncharacterized protein n=1 Tax=marine sediment metagenome TaxID=412755 RepID=X1NP35_9ZZZZ